MALLLVVVVVIVIQSVVAWMIITSTIAQTEIDFGLMDLEVCSSAFGILPSLLGEL